MLCPPFRKRITMARCWSRLRCVWAPDRMERFTFPSDICCRWCIPMILFLTVNTLGSRGSDVPVCRCAAIANAVSCVFAGWDISSLDLGRAMERAQVLDWSLQEKVRPHMDQLKPRPSVYIPDFIAANQEQRADNLIRGNKAEQVKYYSQLHCMSNKVLIRGGHRLIFLI